MTAHGAPTPGTGGPTEPPRLRLVLIHGNDLPVAVVAAVATRSVRQLGMAAAGADGQRPRHDLEMRGTLIAAGLGKFMLRYRHRALSPSSGRGGGTHGANPGPRPTSTLRKRHGPAQRRDLGPCRPTSVAPRGGWRQAASAANRGSPTVSRHPQGPWLRSAPQRGQRPRQPGAHSNLAGNANPTFCQKPSSQSTEGPDTSRRTTRSSSGSSASSAEWLGPLASPPVANRERHSSP